jgi:hypothetical protein
LESPKSPPSDRDFWSDLRETVRHGIRELRDVGDDLAQQGRVRMDMFQTERRLKEAYRDLGEAAYQLLGEQQSLAADDPQVNELTARIRYYSEELERLRSEQRRPSEKTT